MVDVFGFPTAQQQPGQNALGQVAAGPQGQPQTQKPASPEDEGNLKNEWMKFLQSTETRAALLQFAVSVLQPRAPGQSTGGAIGNALAQGGQAAARVRDKQEQDQQRQILNQREERKLELEEEKVGISREGVAVDREAIASRESIADKELAARLKISANELAGRRAELQASLAQDERQFGSKLRADAINKAMATAFEGFDPTLFDNPEQERARRMELARELAQSALRQQAIADNLDKLTDDSLVQMFAQSPDPTELFIVLSSQIPSERLQPLADQGAELRKTTGAAVEGAGGSSPPPDAAPPPPPPVSSAKQLFDQAVADINKGAASATNPITGQGRPTEEQLKAQKRAAAEQVILPTLPATIEAIPADTLAEMLRDEVTRELLVKVYGEAKVGEASVKRQTTINPPSTLVSP